MTSAGRKIKKNKGYFLFYGLVIILSSLNCSQSLLAADESTAKLIEGAKKEGKLAIYFSMSIPDSAMMVNKFQTKYPFIKIEHTRASSESMLVRLLNEARAKKYVPDVIQNGTFELYLLKKNGLLAKYLSPERKAYGEQFKDSDGYFTDNYIVIKPILYNTKLVPLDKAPKSYEDLLGSQWSEGKLVFEGRGDASGVRFLLCIMKLMGEKKGEDFLRRLARQRLIMRSGTVLVATLIAAGEFPIAVSNSGNTAELLKEKGAPVEWVRNDPMLTTHVGISLSPHASSPNSAKLFIDFILSKEGQEIFRGMHRIPARSDVEPDPPRLLRGFKTFPYDPVWSEEYEKYVKKFREIFG